MKMKNNTKYTKIVQNIFSQIQSNDEEIIFNVSTNAWIAGDKLYQNIQSVQSYFIESWIKSWDIIVIFLKDQIDFLTVLLAGISLWWVVAIVEPDMWKKVLEEKINTLKPKYVFIEWMLYDIFIIDIFWVLERYILKNIPKNIFNIGELYITGWTSYLSKSSNTLQAVYARNGLENPGVYEGKESDSALIVFTGGTTSDPKWVIHTHNSLLHTILEIQNIVGDYEVFYADLFHFTLLWIASWSKVILWDEWYSSKKVQDIFLKHKVECSFFAPYKLQKFIDDDIKFTPYLDCIITWSAPVYNSFLTRLYAHMWDDIMVLCLYGMTEILPIAYIEWKEKLNLHLRKWNILWKPITWIEYSFKDWEFIVSGQHGSKQYLWKTNHKNIKTWDLVEEKDGYLVMRWRKKDMILRGNYNIYPQVYEPIISSIPWIRECAIFWINESDIDEFIILLLDSDIAYSQKDIYRLLEKGEHSIDNYALPQYIFFWKIPKFGRQKKIHKNKLNTLYSQRIIWK